MRGNKVAYSLPPSLPPSLSLSFPVDAHARTHAYSVVAGGCQVISCTKNQLTGASYRDTSPPSHPPPPSSSLISKKDADLPKEYMSPKKTSIIQQGRRAPKPKPVVKPLIMLLILRKKKSFQPFFFLLPLHLLVHPVLLFSRAAADLSPCTLLKYLGALPWHLSAN